jgi:hypothetical protein
MNAFSAIDSSSAADSELDKEEDGEKTAPVAEEASATAAAAAATSILRSWFDQSLFRPPGAAHPNNDHVMAAKLMQLQTAQRLALQAQFHAAEIEDQNRSRIKRPLPPPPPPLPTPLDLRKPAESLISKHHHHPMAWHHHQTMEVGYRQCSRSCRRRRGRTRWTKSFFRI